MGPEAAETTDHPITYDLQHEIVGNERPKDDGVRRYEEEQRGDPGEVRRGYDWIERAPRFLPARGEQSFGVLRRVECPSSEFLGQRAAPIKGGSGSSG